MDAVQLDFWENKAFVDEDETDKDEGWCVCPTCKEKVGALCKSGFCAECGKKWRWLYGDICGMCYEKKRKKADEIARGFKDEGWKEVPEKERENATYSLGGWIDERDMDATEPRVGMRYFLIDVRHLTWRFFFRKGA